VSALIGIRIEFYDAEGEFGGAMYCEDKFEVVAIPHRGDLICLAAIPGQTTPLAEIQGVQGLAEEFPFMKVANRDDDIFELTNPEGFNAWLEDNVSDVRPRGRRQPVRQARRRSTVRCVPGLRPPRPAWFPARITRRLPGSAAMFK
jgi:hypothetical protein